MCWLLWSHSALTALLATLSYTGSPSSRLRRLNSRVRVPAPAVHVSRRPLGGIPWHRFTWGGGWVEQQSNPAHYTTCTHAQHTHTHTCTHSDVLVYTKLQIYDIQYTDTLHTKTCMYSCTYTYRMYLYLYMYNAETFWPGYPPTSFPPPSLFIPSGVGVQWWCSGRKVAVAWLGHGPASGGHRSSQVV